MMRLPAVSSSDLHRPQRSRMDALGTGRLASSPEGIDG